MAATQLLGRTLLSVCALIGAVLMPATAAAQPMHSQTSEATGSASVMRLSVDTVASTPPKTVWLTCHPAGGTHPTPFEACQRLAAVGGEFSALSPRNPDSACVMIYSPVTATAVGYWHGSTVRYQHTYANYCLMLKDTGAVFDF